MQNQQNSRFNVGLYGLVVVLRPGRPEVRILPVVPENLIAMCFLQRGFLFLLVFDFQNNFSSISSAASVYCPFPRRSFLSLFIVIRMRRISSVEKVAFLSAGTESIFSIHNVFSVIVIYAVGGCILSGIFSVGETKSLETLSAKIHGYGSVIGFLLLTLAPLFVGLYFFKVSNGLLGILSLICFIFAIVFFALFVMADKPNYRGTIIAFEGLWQRLSLLSMYLPIAALCIFQK